MNSKPPFLFYLNLSLMLFATFFLVFYLFIRFNGRLGSQINIISATYGNNCGGKKNNVKNEVSKWCNGKFYCSFTPTHIDPAVGCRKDYSVNWTCSKDKKIYPIFVANHKDVPPLIELKCPIL